MSYPNGGPIILTRPKRAQAGGIRMFSLNQSQSTAFIDQFCPVLTLFGQTVAYLSQMSLFVSFREPHLL